MRIISLDSFISEIESTDFFSNIVLINNIDSFLLLLQSNASIQDLINLIKINSDYIEFILERIKKLWEFKNDINKLHLYDHSIAIYLYSIYSASKQDINDILKFVSQNRLKNLYWTYLIYNYILENKKMLEF